MNFELSKEQEMTRKMVRDFAEEKIAPRAVEIDKNSEFPEDLFKEMGELGFSAFLSLKNTEGVEEIRSPMPSPWKRSVVYADRRD